MSETDWIQFADAADKGDVDEIARILQSSSSELINDKDDASGMTALMYAAVRGHAGAVRLILDSPKASPVMVNMQDANGISALMYAAVRGHADAVRLILDSPKASPVMVNMQDANGISALMYAAAHGHADVIRYLIGKGADINARDNEEWTAIMYAASHGHANIVDYILQSTNHSREVVDAKNEHDLTSLLLAAANNHLDVVHLLWDSYGITGNNDRTALMYAVYHGHAGVVRELLTLLPKKAVNAVDTLGYTALMYAAKQGHADVVRDLLASEKVDRTIRNKGGDTAAVIALMSYHFSIATMIDPSITVFLLFPFLLF